MIQMNSAIMEWYDIQQIQCAISVKDHEFMINLQIFFTLVIVKFRLKIFQFEEVRWHN